jgi:hypothetical protein
LLYTDERSFKVVLQSILGSPAGVEVKKKEEEDKYDDFMIDWRNYAGKTHGPLYGSKPQHKRKENGSGSGRHNKRPRT